MTPPDDSERRADPRLTWAADGSPRSGRFGDVYFSTDDGLAETRAVFLDGCGLPGAWAGRDRFVVAELGFGSGLNIAALLDLWRRTRPPGGRLHVFSIEAWPLSVEEARRALSAWPEISDAASALLERWPEPTPGFHRLDLPDFHAVFDLAVGEVDWALAQWDGLADAWFLDGFSPALNPAMWSDDVLDAVARRSAPGARLATFTVAGAVRRGLAARGFQVDKRPGHGRKRERLEAVAPSSSPSSSPRSAPARPEVAVVGAGIAGAALARALDALGCAVTVIEAEGTGAGASGFPVSLVTPRLDVGDAEVAALYARAITRAGDLYRRLPGAVVAEGVVQLHQAARDAARFDRVAAQSIWPAGAMTPLSPEAASVAVGEPVETGGLAMAGALAVRGPAILEPWLTPARRVAGRVARPEPSGGRRRVLDADGRLLAEVDAVVLAAGWGLAELMPDLPLSPVKGQADWAPGVSTPSVAWGGYAASSGEALLYGATHQRGLTDVATDDAASRANLETVRRRLPRLAERIDAAGPGGRRAAVRATTPDRLPLAGPAPALEGVWLLGGLGSRGFAAAPLLAEHVAAGIAGAPSPLPADLARRVDPGRFTKALAEPRRSGDA